MQPLKIIDKFLNQITMYRLLVYGLSLLLAAAMVLSLIGTLPLSAGGIAATTAILLGTCYIANRSLAILWSATSNSESWLITALILACILPPSTSVHQLAFVGVAGLLAMGSKYIIARHRKHLFNPAAFAALILGLTGWLPAVWWIGTPSMLPLPAIFGLLVVRKIRRFQLFLSFLAASLAVAVVVGVMHQQAVGQVLLTAFRSSPLVFLGTIMLTEPETMPPRVWQQRCYGLLVGALFTSQLRLGFVSATPELALLLGNLYSYAMSPKYKLRLRLKTKRQLAPTIYDFGFAGGQHLDFQPGQYMTWTLPQVTLDRRGNRRTFSIASAPGDSELHLAIKTYVPGSSFKRTLVSLRPGASIMAGQVAGDFVLPHDTHQKLAFIAGGIGITPFVSMAKAMVKAKQRRDIVLFYLVADPADLCYGELWKAAHGFGLRIVPVLTNPKLAANWHGLTGRLNPDNLRQQLPDYLQRRYYLSGPSGLVENYSQLLRQLGIKRQQIITDHFSGY
jgi:ferredoxin-NADP reductase